VVLVSLDCEIVAKLMIATYARRQGVDADPMQADFLRHGSTQLMHGGFACVVCAAGQSLCT